MARRDYQSILSNAVSLPSASGTTYSTNEINMSSGKDAFGTAVTAGPGMGTGTPVFANFLVTANSSSSSAGTLTLNLVHGSATAPTTVLLQLASGLSSSTLVAGYQLSVALPQFPATKKYLRMQLVTAAAGFGAGTYEMWISPMPMASV